MNITRVFVGRIQEKTTAEDLRQFFTDEAEKIDPNAAVSWQLEYVEVKLTKGSTRETYKFLFKF